MAPVPSPLQQRSGTTPMQPGSCRSTTIQGSGIPPYRRWPAHRHFAAWKKLRIGTLSVSHRRLADCSPAPFKTARAKFERSKLRRVRAPPPAGRAFLGSRALERRNLCRDARFHLCPLDSHQRDSRFAHDFVRIVGLNAERRASVSQTFEPSAQPQWRPGWDRPPVVNADGSTDHHFCRGIDVLLHLANANGFDHCHQVSRGQTFDQSLRIPASVRKPREKRLRRLVRWHCVGLFKEYLADALVVHRYPCAVVKSRSAR